MTLAEIRALTLELLGDTAEGSSRWAPNGDFSNVDDAIQWAQEQVAIRMEGVFYFEANLPVVAQAPPAGTPTVPLAYGGVAIPSDSLKVVRVQVSDSIPTYHGKLSLVDAIFAWDGTIATTGQTWMPDWTGHGYVAMSNAGTLGGYTVPIFTGWFTNTSTYVTAPGGTPIVLGRQLAAMDSVAQGQASASCLLNVPNADVSADPANTGATINATWARSLVAVFIRGEAPPTHGFLIALNVSEQQTEWLTLDDTGINLDWVCQEHNHPVGLIPLNGSSHYWDQPGQAMMITLTMDGSPYYGSNLINFGLYINHTLIVTWVNAGADFIPNATGGSGLVVDCQFSGASAVAVADAVLYNYVATQDQVTAMAAAWGL